jgi:hypothetical protein
MTILNLASSKPHITHQDNSQLEIDANFTRLPLSKLGYILLKCKEKNNINQQKLFFFLNVS